MNEQNEIEEDVLAISCEYPLVMNIKELKDHLLSLLIRSKNFLVKKEIKI